MNGVENSWMSNNFEASDGTTRMPKSSRMTRKIDKIQTDLAELKRLVEKNCKSPQEVLRFTTPRANLPNLPNFPMNTAAPLRSMKSSKKADEVDTFNEEYFKGVGIRNENTGKTLRSRMYEAVPKKMRSEAKWELVRKLAKDAIEQRNKGKMNLAAQMAAASASAPVPEANMPVVEANAPAKNYSPFNMHMNRIRREMGNANGIENKNVYKTILNRAYPKNSKMRTSKVYNWKKIQQEAAKIKNGIMQTRKAVRTAATKKA